jgi:DNA/RNA-binding domain of Phe-tRNA-synthetase-like protein
MEFQHAAEIWRDFPGLVPAVMFVDGITPDAKVTDSVARFGDIARSRLAEAPESEFPEIQAWRRAFTRMGLKPTQYRCASESAAWPVEPASAILTADAPRFAC